MDDGTAEGIAAPSSASRSAEAAELAKALGVGADTVDALVQAGYTSVQSVRELSETALELLGVSTSDVERIRRRPAAAPPAGADRTAENDQIVQRWVGTVRRAERPRRPRVAVPTKDSTDTLRKWVEGDDGAMEEWIQSSDAARAPASTVVPSPGSVDPEEAARRRTVEEASAPVLEREETVVRWLMGLLDRVKSDQFDPSTMIQETQDLHRQLYDERTKRKQLEEEIEHVKRGSIAVIKYVRSHEAKEKEIAVRAKEDEIAELKLRLLALEGAEARSANAEPVAAVPGAPPSKITANAVERATREIDQRLREEFSEREHAYIERETELRRRTIQLESEVRNLQSEVERARERGALIAGGPGSISEEVDQRLREVDQREKDLVTRENELRARFEEIKINSDEVDRRRSPLEFKERELGAYEQQLQTRKQALDIEARRLEELRRQVGG
ncbi:MAG: hypothetical protein WBF81_05395, partial [Thermoplasmata archaeon]